MTFYPMPQATDGQDGSVRPALPTRPPEPTDPNFPPAEQALARRIAEERQQDPLAGPKIGSRLFYDNLVQTLQTDPNGVRAELLVAIPAILAGYACQAATWESLVVKDGYPVKSVFLVAEAVDGALYPFSDPMNRLLLEDRMSVWNLTQAAARHHGAQTFQDMDEVAGHVARSIGTPAFGRPRLPAGLSLGSDSPTAILEAGWNAYLPLLGLVCAAPEEWPFMFSLAIQRAIGEVKEAIDPARACVIALECAVPTAHFPFAESW